MNAMNKLKVFLTLDIRTMLLLVEALFFLGWARILVSLPFSKVAPSLGAPMQETSIMELERNRIVLKHIASAIDIMSKYTLWESKCLVKAIAGMKMLKRRNIESTLYLGTTKDELAKMIAHAWLRSGHFYVTGKEGMDRFTVVAKFAKQINANR
ncbi:lasso peptide biosynthesis B2 protein [Paenibacillus sp. Soil724D2]|uniref:lasso peptide biosynthesis B2 protein n=1 Tax=Paenibacillus sp. (strain Soil724D2) TaxID=1736392 RepID=UPI00071637C8|nr:lasso peptide biosynthesis B2 protein [Paenibacillus sp. Soil724D2]KRE51009.1 stage V sporulation protein S [Paenibacillus sp. Soil724D2]